MSIDSEEGRPSEQTAPNDAVISQTEAAVVRSVSTEAAVRFHRYRKGPFFGDDIANGPLFLQLAPDARND